MRDYESLFMVVRRGMLAATLREVGRLGFIADCSRSVLATNSGMGTQSCCCFSQCVTDWRPLTRLLARTSARETAAAPRGVGLRVTTAVLSYNRQQFFA